jgi:hypothetical protein
LLSIRVIRSRILFASSRGRKMIVGEDPLRSGQADFSVLSAAVGALAGAGGIEPPNGGIKIRYLPQQNQRPF